MDRSQIRILTTVALFVVMASGWNLVGGLTGYGSFANVAFFGLGAYTCAVAMDVHRLHLPMAAGIAPAPLVPAAFAALVGLPLLRLRGHYFAIATLGTAVAVGEVVTNVDYLGSATGLFPPILHSADLLFLYLMAGAALLAVIVSQLIRRSRFGLRTNRRCWEALPRCSARCWGSSCWSSCCRMWLAAATWPCTPR